MSLVLSKNTYRRGDVIIYRYYDTMSVSYSFELDEHFDFPTDTEERPYCAIYLARFLKTNSFQDEYTLHEVKSKAGVEVSYDSYTFDNFYYEENDQIGPYHVDQLHSDEILGIVPGGVDLSDPYVCKNYLRKYTKWYHKQIKRDLLNFHLSWNM